MQKIRSLLNNHLALIYYLYPITIQQSPRQKLINKNYQIENPHLMPPEILLVYRKAKARESVPRGFKIVAQYDKNSLIAVRE